MIKSQNKNLYFNIQLNIKEFVLKYLKHGWQRYQKSQDF